MFDDKTEQSGRSMVEIIGVLAVIGVITVAAVMGYTYSMDKVDANDILNDVKLRMTDVESQVAQGVAREVVLDGWEETGVAGYVMDLFDNEEIGPSIMVEEVPSSICKIILKSADAMQEICVGRKINEEEVTCSWYEDDNEDICNGDDKEILFAFKDEIQDAMGRLDDEEEEIVGCKENKECSGEGVCIGCVIPEGEEYGSCQFACRQLEYLESNGSQYIDTGVRANQDTKVEYRVATTSTDYTHIWVMGAVEGNAVFGASIYPPHSDSQLKMWVSFGIDDSAHVGQNVRDWGIKTHAFDGMPENNPNGVLVSLSKDGFYVNGTETRNISNIADFEVGPLYLFGAKGVSGNLRGRIYSFDIWQDGTKIRHFLPYLDPNGVPAMYDDVENKLYYNSGSGAFTYH